MDYKRLPYGVADYTWIKSQNRYCADKTMFIPKMEEAGDFLYLIRPRRFGKSVFLTMLQAYYDIEKKDSFHTTFKDTWIESHPTEGLGKYQVLYFDFSRAVAGQGSLEENFNAYCCTILDDFIQKYATYYDESFNIKEYLSFTSASYKLNALNTYSKRKGTQLYLIIDEYDNFTNNILSEEGEAVYHSLTHAQGFYRDFFKLFKGMFQRIMMMGVSPVTVNDLNSGYNIGTNLSMDPMFNMMLGFSENEVREMIEYYRVVGLIKVPTDQLITDMKPWYDNYCFAKDSLVTDPKMFNSDMVIYYLRHFIRFGKAPDEMVDPNTMTDYAKMKKIIFLDKLQGDRKSVLKEIINQGYIWAELRESFPAEDLVDPDLFPSLLYYYGMLTIIGKRGRRVKLGIPNENVRRQYYGYVLDEYNRDAKINNNHLADRYDVMALDGNIKPAIEYIAEGYRNCTSIHSSIQAERNLQGFIAAYLNHSGYYYIIQEMELNGGYCDLTMIPDLTRFPEVAHAYLLELKYLKTGDTDEEGNKALEEARAQLEQYAQDTRLPQLMNGKPIHKIAIIYKGNDLWKVAEY
ncbi:AAA family ATPase [Segatella copri]|uniref:AAA family ATPase n=1 Tax=Segatella copri TaxID=165179 RepID=UPI00193291A4|nr:AAA family ATPase [Segatella copri]MBM0144860.1 ATP-binding protein [Segatella copri]